MTTEDTPFTTGLNLVTGEPLRQKRELECLSSSDSRLNSRSLSLTVSADMIEPPAAYPGATKYLDGSYVIRSCINGKLLHTF